MRVCTLTFAACMLACVAARAAETQTTERATANGQVVRSSDLSGLVVYNPKNERLGKIEDLVIDPASGKIRYAVLSFGNLFSDKYFAIPWHTISFVAKGETRAGTPKESYAVLNVNEESLKNAPGFDKSHWPNFADSNMQQKIDEYYRTRAAEHGQGQTR